MLEEKLVLIGNSLSHIAAALERIADRVEAVPGAAKSEKPGMVDRAATSEKDNPANQQPLPARKGRRTKAEIEADRQKAEDAPTDMFETAAPAPQKAFTELDVRNFAKAALDAVGWQVVEDLIGKYAKTKKVKDIKAADYATVIEELQQLTKTGTDK